MSASNRARIEAYIGASGSGKGVSIKRRLSQLAPSRLVIWDPRDEYRDQAPAVRSLPELVRLVSQAGAGPLRVRYVPGGAVKLAEAFAIVCQLVFRAGALVFLAEELSDVTTASHAPPAWRQVITQGRHKGLHVLGAAQRPTLIDKTFLGNCTVIRCGLLGYEADRRHMAIELGVPPELLAELDSIERPGGGAELRMLERDRQARSVEWVRLTVSAAGKVTERRADATSPPLRRGPGRPAAKPLQ